MTCNTATPYSIDIHRCSKYVQAQSQMPNLPSLRPQLTAPFADHPIYDTSNPRLRGQYQPNFSRTVPIYQNVPPINLNEFKSEPPFFQHEQGLSMNISEMPMVMSTTTSTETTVYSPATAMGERVVKWVDLTFSSIFDQLLITFWSHFDHDLFILNLISLIISTDSIKWAKNIILYICTMSKWHFSDVAEESVSPAPPPSTLVTWVISHNFLERSHKFSRKILTTLVTIDPYCPLRNRFTYAH